MVGGGSGRNGDREEVFQESRLGKLPLLREDKLMPGGPYHQEGPERELKHYPAQTSQILSPPRFSFITSSSTDSIE